MARTLVLDRAEDTRFPFLRGILTRSLQDAGLPFETAYKLATKIRDELATVEEIATDDLRELVLARLEKHGTDVMQRYLHPVVPTSIVVRYADGHTSPFSRGRHRLGLASCGLGSEDALTASTRIYEDLVTSGTERITSTELRHLTYRHLTNELGGKAARKYLAWQAFKRSNRSLLLLIGGGVGSGKSTVAAQVVNRLEIVRIQSTDMLREVMRVMVPARLMPVLHESSFNAWRQMPTTNEDGKPSAQDVVDGYLVQAEHVSVATEAVIHRATRERVSLILEGVHAHPRLLPGLEDDADAIVIRVVLGVLKKSALRARIKGRGKKEPDRRAKRYLRHFDEIWNLQSFMLSEADETDVPIVENEELDETVLQVMDIVMEKLMSEFTGKPEDVF